MEVAGVFVSTLAGFLLAKLSCKLTSQTQTEWRSKAPFRKLQWAMIGCDDIIDSSFNVSLLGGFRMKRIAIIGCGALGQTLARNLKKVLADRYTITGILTRTPQTEFVREIGCKAYKDFSELLSDQPDYAVEIAGVPAVAEYGEAILNHGIDLIVVSVGALADKALYASLQRSAEQSGRRIYIASGAIGGFDLMRTFALMGPMAASIENFKPPEGLEGAPYLAGRSLSRTEPETIFTGSVAEAILGFPKNVNVAMATDIAVACDTEVIIQSVPNLPENRHVIRLKNDNAHAELFISSAPDPKNPKSSTFTAWSVIALLDNLDSTVQFF